ncbi:hypothetical protein [Phenylobacterium sp.]|uniref:hypothetical protein n=1 Tax=Phenylobacterium sp. TaxID=1871053 RepID=UPI00301CC2B2
MSKGAMAVALTLGRGEAETTYWLQYDVDKMAQLEELLDLDIEEINRRIATSKRIGFARAVLWAGLQAHHPDIALKPAGELLRLPGADKVGEKVLAALEKAFPSPEAAEGLADPPPTPEG